jgi:DoxX-like family
VNKKTTNILYWIFTTLFSALMLFSSIPDILVLPDAIKFIVGLQLPAYIAPMLGWAKLAGVIAILIPGFPRIKEWAYAGLIIDLAGATYCQIAVFGFKPQIALMLVFIAMGFASYYFYHKKSHTK